MYVFKGRYKGKAAFARNLSSNRLFTKQKLLWKCQAEFALGSTAIIAVFFQCAIEPIHNHVAFSGPSFTTNTELQLSSVAQSSSVEPALLATALVKLRGADGRIHTARAMIDPGSQSFFVFEVLLKKLGQPYSATTVPLSGIGGYSHIPAKGRTTLQLTSAFNPKAHLQLNALVLPFITKYSQRCHNLKNAWTHLEG